jgi:murein DD-endopeptidase MepM/ murein hydrolase activator NlpD
VRSLFVRHAPLRHLRRTAAALRPRSTGVLGPLALAVGLAVAGHQLAAPAAPTVTARPGVAAERPERAPLAFSGTLRENVVARRLAPGATPARASRSRRAPVGAWVRPAYGPFTSPFGYRWGKLHAGIDIGASYGSPIYAASDGVVTFAGPKNGYGRLVVISHGNGVETAYGHMSRTVTHAGQRVHAGDVIAYVGSEGHSTGPHLHFEVRIGGRAIDPRPFLRARGVWI